MRRRHLGAHRTVQGPPLKSCRVLTTCLDGSREGGEGEGPPALRPSHHLQACTCLSLASPIPSSPARLQQQHHRPPRGLGREPRESHVIPSPALRFQVQKQLVLTLTGCSPSVLSAPTWATPPSRRPPSTRQAADPLTSWGEDADFFQV